MRGICWIGKVVKLLAPFVLVIGLLGCSDRSNSKQLDNQLVRAVINRDQNLVRTYLQQGANPNTMNALGIPIIFSAISGDNSTCDHEILSALLEHGADVNVNYGSISALMSALMTNDIWCVRVLVDYGAKLNGNSDSTLHRSIKPGSVDILTYLLKNGFDPCVKDGKGETMLDISMKRGDKEFVGILEKIKCY